MKTRTKHTAAAVERALAAVESMAAMTPYETAERRFLAAKRAFNDAAEAVLAQEIGAALQADEALAEFNAALDALRSFEGTSGDSVRHSPE